MLPRSWDNLKIKLHEALELPPERRAAYLDEVAAGNPELRRELDSLIASHEQASTNFLQSPLSEVAKAFSAECDYIGRRLGPYQITSQIGVGGMGAVYRAFRADDQYRKEAAIKLVRSGQGSGVILSRFKNERQILATLEHPNIARLLDGGTTEEGLPYVVMELIDGEPIDDFCEQHALSVQERLELFLQVCSAVQYAHQHLIIHRDIKPGNILVTRERVPKLLDFGIAKLLDPTAAEDLAPTMTIFQVLTPSYASPEQIKGENITTATDVYSLGVVLYELLTGHSPYLTPIHTPQDAARVVSEFEPAKPSERVEIVARAKETQAPIPGATGLAPEGSEKLSKYLRGDLDNIVLMALRKEPQRRYASVEQFAEDIRRHLRNVPVLARKDTLRYRTAKFITRHKAGVAASAMVTLALVLGMVVTLREARVAQRRFNDVRSLANSLMFDVHDSIRDLPGATAARKLIIEKALKYLDSLAEEARNDPGLQRELAAGYKRIGDVQGYQFSANIGDTASALTSYQKAVAIRRGLFAAHPNNLEDALALSESLQDMAETLLASGDTNGAMRNIQQAVEISEQMERAHPNDVKVLTLLKDNYQTQADMLAGNFNVSNLGDNSAALVYRQKELKIAEQIAALQPNDPSVQRDTAVTVTKVGDQLLLNGQQHEAMVYYQRAEKRFESLVAQSPSARVLDNLHGIYTRLQQVEMWGGNPNQAVVTNRKALELSQKMSLVDPNNSYEQLVLAGDYGNLADSLSRAGVKEEALSAANQAVKMMADLVHHNPKNTEYLGMQAAEYVTAGDVSRRFADYPRAQRNYHEARTISLLIQDADPNNADVRLRIAAISTELGLTLLRMRDLKGATEAYNQALQITEPQLNSGHPSQETLYSTANAYAGLGEIEVTMASGMKHTPEQQRAHLTTASSWYERSLKIWSEVKEPGAVSPEGFEPFSPSLVNARLSDCKTRLATLQGTTKTQ